MTITDEPTNVQNLDIYDHAPLVWEEVQAALGGDVTQAPGTGGPDRHTYWLATTDADGRAHVTGVGVFYLDGAFYFTAGAGTRKARNLAREPRCALAVALDDFDVTVEGRAERVTDEAFLERFAAEAAAGGWPAEARDGAIYAEFSAPSAGPPPWGVYRVTAETVVALGTAEPGGATRWRF